MPKPLISENCFMFNDNSTDTILNVFTEEIARHSGRVADTFDDGTRLFSRSILPKSEEIKPRDQVQPGVALKATPEEICVYPYVFRQVCRNGAIMAFSLGGRRLMRSKGLTPEEELSSLRETIDACCQEESFAVSVSRIRSSLGGKVDFSLTMLPFISRLRNVASGEIIGLIVERFFREGDQSPFGLMNAITFVARDRTNPDERWELEEFGGGVAAKTPSVDPLTGRVDRGGLVPVG
jgi:hypothetical protein